MKELKILVTETLEGDMKSYAEIIDRFKSMAFGYSYEVEIFGKASGSVS